MVPNVRTCRRVAAMAAAIVAAAPARSAHAQDASVNPAAITSADSTMVRAAAAIFRAASEVEGIWPGYWPMGAAVVLLHPSQTVMVVSAGRPPHRYAPLEGDDSLPGELRGHTYVMRGTLPGVHENSFATRVPMGADSVWAVAPAGAGFYNQLEFYYHEHFHLAHQRGGHFVETPEDRRMAAFREPLVNPTHLTPEFAAAAELERGMLASALEIADADSLRAHLRRYLAARRQRAATKLDVVEVERRMERSEGTAQYVGCRAAAMAAGEPPQRAVACVREQLTRDLEQRADFPEADARLMRWRLYGTGGAIALLLDRLRPGWKPLVEQGMHLDQLLAEAVSFDPVAADRWLAESGAAPGSAPPPPTR